MKILKQNSQISSCSPELMRSPTIAHVNAACRKDFASFVRKVFHVLAPALFLHERTWAVVDALSRHGRKDQPAHDLRAAVFTQALMSSVRSRPLSWATILESG